MSVRIKNGIGVSSYSGNVFRDIGASAIPSDAAEIPSTSKPDDIKVGRNSWADWGVDNRLPIQMANYIETCGILTGIIDHQARLALGGGIIWAWVRTETTGEMIVEEVCQEQEIVDFMNLNNHYFHEFGWMKDQIGFANGIARLVLDKQKQKIALVQRDDITEMRYQKMNDQGKVEKIFLSAQWENISSTEDKNVIPVTLLDFRMPLADLIRRKNSQKTFAYAFRYPSWLKKYYSMPLWWSNLEWVKIARSIPDMKAAMYSNAMRPKYLITIYQQFWDELFVGDGGGQKASWADYTEEDIQVKKNEVYDDIDRYLSGTDNAGKAIFTDGVFDVVNGTKFKFIEVEPLEDTTKDGGYLPDSAAANSEIAFSMRYNPAILGATMPSGPYTNSQGGSSIRESVALQVITHEPERQNILALYRLIRDFNKWNITYAKKGLTLEPIIPATILTTLDTGAGTKPITTGAGTSQAKPNNPSNGTD